MPERLKPFIWYAVFDGIGLIFILVGWQVLGDERQQPIFGPITTVPQLAVVAVGCAFMLIAVIVLVVMFARLRGRTL